MVRSVLLHVVDLAGDKVSRGILGGCWGGRRKIEDAEVIQIADDRIFFERKLAAHGQRVSPLVMLTMSRRAYKSVLLTGPASAPPALKYPEMLNCGSALRSLDRERSIPGRPSKSSAC